MLIIITWQCYRSIVCESSVQKEWSHHKASDSWKGYDDYRNTFILAWLSNILCSQSSNSLFRRSNGQLPATQSKQQRKCTRKDRCYYFFQRIWFFEVFSINPIPSKTFVISYILLFWTCQNQYHVKKVQFIAKIFTLHIPL
jgi:hypothetical protein